MEDEPILTHIFQMGWKHQLVLTWWPTCEKIIDGFLYKLDRYVSCLFPRNCHIWIIWKICRFRDFTFFRGPFYPHFPSMCSASPKVTWLPHRKAASFVGWMIERDFHDGLWWISPGAGSRCFCFSQSSRSHLAIRSQRSFLCSRDIWWCLDQKTFRKAPAANVRLAFRNSKIIWQDILRGSFQDL